MKYYFFEVFFLIKLSLILKSLPIYFFSFSSSVQTTEAWLTFLIQKHINNIGGQANLPFFSVRLKSTVVIFEILMESIPEYQIIVENTVNQCHYAQGKIGQKWISKVNKTLILLDYLVCLQFLMKIKVANTEEKYTKSKNNIIGIVKMTD